jgi:hypothetical protein
VRRIHALCLLGLTFLPSSLAAQPAIVFAPTVPTDSELVFVTVLGDAGGCSAILGAFVDAATSRILVDGDLRTEQEPCPAPGWAGTAAVGHLTPGLWNVSVFLDGEPYATTTLTVVASPTTVVIGERAIFGESFFLEVDWIDPFTGEARRAPGVGLSERAAQFWFFDAELPEVTVKIVDGRAVNGHFWLFASSMTGVEFTLRARGLYDGDPPVFTDWYQYHSAAGQNLDVVDFEALDFP